MKLLIDECLPRALKRLVTGHESRTVQERAWPGKANGELLALAELEFDVLVTICPSRPRRPREYRAGRRSSGRMRTGEIARFVLGACTAALAVIAIAMVPAAVPIWRATRVDAANRLNRG